MAAPKRTPLPAILLANDLLAGDVVFASAGGWSRDPREATIAGDEAEAVRLEAFGAAEFAGRRVVDAYLVDVTLIGGTPVPRHYRERIKTLGPSVRRDLGKQAELGPAG